MVITHIVKVKSLGGHLQKDWHPYTNWLDEREIRYFDYVDANDKYDDTWSFEFYNEEDATMFRLAFA